MKERKKSSTGGDNPTSAPDHDSKGSDLKQRQRVRMERNKAVIDKKTMQAVKRAFKNGIAAQERVEW